MRRGVSVAGDHVRRSERPEEQGFGVEEALAELLAAGRTQHTPAHHISDRNPKPQSGRRQVGEGKLIWRSRLNCRQRLKSGRSSTKATASHRFQTKLRASFSSARSLLAGYSVF